MEFTFIFLKISKFHPFLISIYLYSLVLWFDCLNFHNVILIITHIKNNNHNKD